MLLAKIAMKLLGPKAAAFERSTKDPMASQLGVLKEYLFRNKDTEYGKKYGFSEITSVEEFRKKVPLVNCHDMMPYFVRMTRGEQNILTKDTPVFFGSTSGTTNVQKLIPVTEFSKSKKAEVLNLWAYYIYKDHPDVITGKILAIVSPEIEGHTESGLPYGAESGHGYKTLPTAVRSLYALPKEVFDIMDFDSRYYCILRFAMEKNISTIVTLNPNTIVILCQKIDPWRERLMNDIEKGTLDKDLNIPDEMRSRLMKYCSPNIRRAAQLRGIMKAKGPLLPRYIWPNLKLVECWKAGPMKLYLKELEAYFGNVPIRDIGCLSTEARSSIPISDCGAGGVLAINTNFYEFIPKEDIERADKRVLLADQLEEKKEYYIVVTTPGGLYRYNIDDIIKVDGFFNKTPVIEFVQKGVNAVSLAGEKIYEAHVTEAVNKVAFRKNLLIEFFCAFGLFEKVPRYAFLVEFSGNLSDDNKKEFLKDVENALYMENIEYHSLRKAQLLAPPVLRVVKRGDFERYRVKKVSHGGHDGQFKAPVVSKDCEFYNNFAIEQEISLE